MDISLNRFASRARRPGIARRSGGLARRAFSLIEVMIVIAIILAISGLVALTLFGRRDQAEADLARVEFDQLRRALNLFRLDFNRYPTDEEGIAVLWNKEQLDPEADQEAWKEYLDDPMTNDRWGNPWGYRQQSEETEDATKFDLWSFGPDGEEGTDDDIVSWRTAGDEEGGDLPLPPTGG
ncbi:MAG: type II secretion system major pseudopilin GspG [Phycisphaerales bacterium]|nr:type II secretion system major pseudopilin GspG [Phycisphaerales bacterium]